jgi:hypothetical protein
MMDMLSTRHVSPSMDPHRLPPLMARYPAGLVEQVIAKVRPYTMVPDAGLDCTIRLTLAAIENDVPGDLVECGTWLGGASFAMLLAQRYAFGEIRRPVWMYDSFQGMSPPTAPDGEHARWWWQRAQSGKEDPDHQNFCVASLEEVMAAAEHFDVVDHVRIHAGWLHETLRRLKPQPIAVLRIDCDWYEPVKRCFEALEPRVSVDGPIILDDYYAWEGCVLATHEYLAAHRLPWMIRTAPDLAGAWMIKTKATW